VPAFLSAAWLELLERSFGTIDPSIRLSIEQVVSDAPEGDVRYRITFEGGSARIDGGGGADIELHTPYPVAVALATGEMTANDALRTGLIKVAGDVSQLQAAALLAGALADVRAETTYP
jgi:hypothetical protein